MKYVTNTFGNESQVSGLTPNKEVEGDIEELTAVVGGGEFAAGVGNPDVGFAA